jgi:ABC-2 type transport system ATP-binding protein
MKSGESAISTQELTAVFAGGQGLKDLNLEVRRGEIFGFLGQNGAGKTTTIRLLLGLLRPDRGRATVLGCPVGDGQVELRRRIGFLPSDLALFPDQRGADVLTLFRDLYRAPKGAAEAILDRLGFARAALSRRLRTYSTGMRQMLGIASAFQHDPELYILDEPTTGLDPIVRGAFLELVREARARGGTVFLSSHVLQEIEATADRVGFIFAGRLELVADTEELQRRLPKRVVLRRRGRAPESFLFEGEAGVLLQRLQHEDLIDFEVAPAGLDEIFRSFVGVETRR